MSRRAFVLGLLVIVVAAAVVFVTWPAPNANQSRGPIATGPTPQASSPAPVVITGGDDEDSEPVEPPARPGDPVFVRTPEIIDPETEKPMLAPLPLQQGELAWEARIRGVLTKEGATDAQKAKALLDLLPSMPAEGAVTCVEEALKRLPNAEYRHGQSVVVNPATYGLAQSVLFADLMDRPDELRLPTLITIARNPAHPFAETAMHNLDLLIGKDYGKDWPRWEAAVREKLSAK